MKILFVYIPFSICVLIQCFAVLNIIAIEDKALLMKIILPLVFIASIFLHLKKQRKNGA